MNRKFYKVSSISFQDEEVAILKRRIKGFETMTRFLSETIDRQRKLIEKMQENCICQQSNLTRKAA